MKFRYLLFSLLAFSFSAFANSSSSLPLTTTHELLHPPRWEKLGERRVNYGLDRDEIAVTVREGLFTGIRLKAEVAPLNIHRVVVHFANGSTENINLTQNLRPGQITRVIDLPGNRRVISKVVFWYDTRNRASRRGRIELWGRH